MKVAVSGSFDDLRAPGMRFLEEASRHGAVHVYLWSDAQVLRYTGQAAKFPQAERKYFLKSVRYVSEVTVLDAFPDIADMVANQRPDLVAVQAHDDAMLEFCDRQGLDRVVITPKQVSGFPPAPEMDLTRTAGRKKVLVTGCYDWLHSGHVRFFEEASEYGELYVVVGNDANVTNLKGAGHPLFPQDLRRYMASSIRFVHQALITSGWGWMDAEPEVIRLRPEIYLVNEDGDRPEKREFCQKHHLEYVVLKRLPAPGLDRRSSTDLRGF
jgi:cytidyltransferase-like protein